MSMAFLFSGKSIELRNDGKTVLVDSRPLNGAKMQNWERGPKKPEGEN